MAAKRLREPVVQMRETLVVVKTVPIVESRVRGVEALMRRRGMDSESAQRRLRKALAAIGLVERDVDGHDWGFDVSWAFAWRTIYWPHRTDERHLEQEVLEFCRFSFELAWYGRPTPLQHLAGAFSALEDARGSGGDRPAAGLMVA